jgi:cyclohexyl-isocyanide hydratase
MNAPNTPSKLKVGIPLYPTFDSLDVLGPYQVFTYAPNLDLHLIAADNCAVTSLEGVQILPDLTFASCPQLDVLLVPGAADLIAPLQAGPLGENPFFDFLAKQAKDATLVCTVCTGALIAGAAGLLNGHLVTTHWAHLETLALFPCTVATGYPRYVKSGNRISSGGISSGIDAALFIVAHLFGEEAAMECQLKMQYRPQPPVHAGDPADSDISTHPGLPDKVRSDWHVNDVREAYLQWLSGQS